MSITNSDLASTGDLLSISNAATDANSAGIAIGAPAGSSVGIDIAGQGMTGDAIGIKLGSAGGSATYNTFSGAYLDISPSKTHTGATAISESGNFIRAARTLGINNASGSYTISGDLATLSSNCTVTTGTCTDTSNVLQLTQSYASATGAVLDITNNGLGSGLNLAANAITTGYAMNVTSTSNLLSSGRLASFDWTPTTPTTASGDLIRLNIGSTGDITGNMFNITDSGSSLFRVSTTQMESTVPVVFSAAGDVSLANDLVFTNQTSDNIKSYGPLNIESGESFENNNLTLTTYGTGNIVANLGIGSLIPGTDNYNDVGNSSYRWDDIYATNNVIQTSDIRLKENINTLSYGLNEIMQLNPVSYTWIDRPEKGTKLGLVAQEVLSIIPEAVDIGTDTNRTLGLRYSDFIPVLIKAVQEQQIQIENLNNTGDLQTVADSDRSEYYRLTHKDGTSIEKLTLTGLFTNVFEGVQGSVDNLLVKVGLVSPEVLTNKIKPTEGNKDVTIELGTRDEELGTSEFGRLIIQDRNGTTVAGIDEAGNATFSGELATNDLKVDNNASIAGELHVGRIYADEIISRNGKIGEVQTASISAITREDIEKILAEAEIDQNLLKETNNWNINTATNSATISDINTNNLYVTGTAAVTSLSAADSITVGSDLVISTLMTNNEQTTKVNSIDTLSAPLALQSSGSQPLYIMAGKVMIDTLGNVAINGNLEVAGDISSSSLVLSESSEDTGFGKLLRIQNISGQEVASIDASGSAKFAAVTTKSLIIPEDPAATTSATFDGIVLTSTTSAGKGTIPSNAKEVTIINSMVKADSLIYVTPTTSTGNQTLYVKEQLDGKVVIGIDTALNNDISFNWWIIQTKVNE
jgi:hypothetical protein